MMTESASNGRRGRKRKARRPPDQVRAWTDDRRHALRTFRTLQIVIGSMAKVAFRIKATGLKSIPKRGPVILVTNHVSNIDPIIVVGSMHRPVFHLAKHTLFTKRFRSWFFQTLGGQIPVRRDEPGSNELAIQAAVQALEKGFALGIYPESHRSPDGKLRRGKPGLGRIAYLSGAPIYPVAVDGTLRVWPKGKRLPRLFRRTRLIVGAPRTYAKDTEKAKDRGACQRVTDEVMSDIAALLGQPYDPATAPMPHA